MKNKIISKLRKILDDYGVWDGTLHLIQRALSRLPGNMVLLKYYLVVQKVPSPPVRPRPHTLEINLVASSEYQYEWFPRPPEFIQARFAQGAICFVAFAKDEAVACLWLKIGPYDEDTVRCRFIPTPAAHAAWDFDVYIKPQHRLGRTFMYLWEHAFQWLRDHDIRWTMSRIDAFNLPSIHAHKRLGATIVDHVVFWQCAGRQLTWSTTAPRLIISQKRLPVITITPPSI